MISKKLIFGLFQVFIVFLISVYVESVASGELLFTKNLLAESLRSSIIKNPIVVLILLGLINLIVYYLLHRDTESNEVIKLHNNICQLIFDSYIKPDRTLENSKFRVSTFKAQKKLIFRREKYFLPEYRTTLRNIGRYQTRQEKKRCKVKFLPGEGVVGTCYLIGEFVFDEIDEFTEANKNNYIDQQVKVLNIPKYKAKRLNDISCSYICCPIKLFKSDDIYGVVVVDSTASDVLQEQNFRAIEDVLKNFSVFFDKSI